MVVTPLPLNCDLYSTTGADNVNLFPPVATRVLTKEELEELLGLYQGSGGQLSGLSNTVFSGTINIIINEDQVDKNSKLDSIINTISDTFGLTKDDLTKICRVQSRKTLYNWIDGTSTPRNHAMHRIYNLYNIAQAWLYAGFQLDKATLHFPVLDTNSIFDLLSQDELDKEQILFAGSRLSVTRETKKSIKDPFA